MIISGALLIGTAICIAFRRGVPKSFPWLWALLFSASLLIGAFSPLGSLERWYYSLVLLAAFIVGSHIQKPFMRRVLIGVGIFLAIVTVADALRIIPAVDAMVSDGEQAFGGLVRRPYALAHPNLVAAWSVMLPFGVWTLTTVIVTQSRGALLGLLPVLVMRHTPRRYMVPAVLAGIVLFGGAVAFRPGTAFDRVNFWEEGTRFFLARPLTGWGSGSYRASITQRTPQADVMNAVVNGKRTGMHTAHNALITIAAENGLLGLVPFCGFVVRLFSFVNRSGNPMKWGILAFAIQQIFDDQWLHPVTSIVFGLTLAMLSQEKL